MMTPDEPKAWTVIRSDEPRRRGLFYLRIQHAKPNLTVIRGGLSKQYTTRKSVVTNPNDKSAA